MSAAWLQDKEGGSKWSMCKKVANHNKSIPSSQQIPHSWLFFMTIEQK